MVLITQQFQDSEFDADSLKRSFDDLPVDPYLSSGTRYRALSTFSVLPGDRAIQLPEGYLYQKRPGLPNSETEGIKRKYQPIDPEVIKLPAFRQMRQIFADKAAWMTNGSIDIHQIRIATSDTQLAAVAPEGPHRDGVRFLGIMGIRRQNCRGGDVMLLNPHSHEIEYQKQMIPGLWVAFDDMDYFHYGSPINVVLPSLGRAILDFFVLTTPSLVRYDQEQGEG